MSKPRKPSSRRPSKKKIQEMERRKRVEAAFQKMYDSICSTVPTENSKEAIEECKQRVKEGRSCYCKTVCKCRDCLNRKEICVCSDCNFKASENESKCLFGCDECSEGKPCY